MAVLTRPLFHSQERIDLEDLNQLLSGLRTDARLWTRQLYADKNFIVKGFDVTGLGTNALTVNLLDSTLLFAGRRDLTGTASIGVDDAAVVGDTVTIANSDGTEIVLTAVASGNTGTTFGIGSNAATLAANLGEAIALSSNDLSTSVDGTTITVTASRTGYITIVASNTAPFNNTGNIIGTFDYTSTSISSPADLSYFIIESDATVDETRLTREIAASERAPTGSASRTLYIYGTLVTEQGTPITKAFWDPSANSGSGAEFNQRVDTSVDTAMQLNVSTSKLNQATDEDAETFFANVAICEIDVDTSGIILAIRDTRPLLFEADDERPWERTNAFATIGVAQTVTDVTVTTMVNGVLQVPNATSFTLDETLDIYPTSGSVTAASTVSRVTAVSGSGAIQTLEISKLRETSSGEPGLSAIPAAQSIAIGRTSGAIKIINSVTSNFFRDDKSLGDFRNSFSALATEINNVKGTENWYDDPPATVKDILRFINSTVIGIDPAARYSWNASDDSDGTLSIRRDPLSTDVTLTVELANGLVANQTLVFTNTTGGNTRTLTAVSSNPGTNQFLIGVDAEATASHLSSAINALTDFQAFFNQSGSDFIITIGSNDSTFTDVTSNLTNVIVAGSPFTYSTVGNLANIKLYGTDADFFITTQDLIIAENEVLFVTLPDLSADTVASQTYDQPQFRYSASGPTVDQDLWNSTNRALFVDATDRFKTVPVNDFECNDRNYWIAYRDTTETIFVRDIGELGNNEAANIGHGISNATLSYIGAPDENDSTPEYPAVDTINTFTGDGAYLATVSPADFNRTIVAQSENLTSAVNDLNNHLTSIKDTQYQNLSIKLVNGGLFDWDSTANNGTFGWNAEANIQVPGISLARNAIAAQSFTNFLDGNVIYVDINRQEGTAATIAIAQMPEGDFIVQRDRFVIARRIGGYVYIGVNGTTRLASGQAAPLESALQYLGLGQNELPRQLNTHESDVPVTPPGGTEEVGHTVDVETSTVLFPIGGVSTPGIEDDNIQLDLSINSGLLYWEGATFDFVNGLVYNVGTTDPFRTETPAPSFGLTTLAASQQAWYAISLDGDTTITDGNKGVIPADEIGKKRGDFNVTQGTATDIDAHDYPEFGGALPIAYIRVRKDSSNAFEVFTANDFIVLAASGGGGGGSGDASQDLNNYLNRLNLSTFEYFTPLIAAVSTTENVGANTDAAVAAAGFAVIADSNLTTTNLLDDEFLAESITPDRVEIEAFWAINDVDQSIRIDPNAKWSISYSASDAIADFTPITEALSIPVVGFINSSSVLVGQNLSNLSIDNIIFADNHRLSTGHKINLSTLGGLDPVDPDAGTLATTTQFYVHVIDNDAFTLHNTRVNADSGDTPIVIQGTAISGSVFNRDAGIIDRIGVTNAVRGVFDLRERTLDGNAYSPGTSGEVRIIVVGDTSAAIRVQNNDGLMTSMALFYNFNGAAEGINPNSVPDISTLLSDNHLGAGSPTPGTESTTVSRAVAGRGILLKDSGTGTPLREIAIIDGVLSVTDDTGEFQAIAARDAEGNLIVP